MGLGWVGGWRLGPVPCDEAYAVGQQMMQPTGRKVPREPRSNPREPAIQDRQVDPVTGLCGGDVVVVDQGGLDGFKGLVRGFGVCKGSYDTPDDLAMAHG